MDVLSGGGAAAPQGVEAGQGFQWWTRGWALFMRQPGWWVVLGLVFSVLVILVSAVVPLLGALAAALVTPALVAGFMLAARKVQGGGTLEVGDLFAAFRGARLTPLLVLGALLAVAAAVLGFVAGALGLGAVFGVAAGGMAGSVGGVMAGVGAGMLGLLVSLLFGAVLGMVFWFAPALVVFRGVEPVPALKASFDASLKNIVPFLLYSIVYFVVAFVASIPFGLGWLVLVPVMLLTVYVSYEDVFGRWDA